MKQIWEKGKESRWGKVLGVVLLGVSGTLILLTIAAMSLGPREDYLSYQMEKDVYDAVHTGTLEQEDTAALAALYSAENSNLRLQLLSYKDGSVRMEVQTATADMQGTAIYALFYEDPSQSGYYSMYYLDTAPVSRSMLRSMVEHFGAPQGWYAIVKLADPLEVRDVYWRIDRFYSFMDFLNRYPAAVLAASILLFILALVYEFSAAGHVKGKEGIQTVAVDRMPFEILTLLMFSGVLIIARAFSGFSLVSTDFITLIIFDIVAFAASLLFFFWLMSTARRIKAGIFADQIGLLRLWLFLYKTAAGHPVRIAPYLMTAGFYFLALFLIGIGRWEMSSGLVMLCFLFSTFLFAYLEHYLWMNMKLQDMVEQLYNGNLAYRTPEKDLDHMYGAMRRHVEHLNDLGSGVEKSMQERLKAERLKAELITNVSHDIKTPLTSIINYVDLLKKNTDPEKQQEYLEVLDRQSQRLKKLTEDVLESSKASSGNIDVHLEPTSAAEIIDQALGEYQERLDAANLNVIVKAAECPPMMADGRLLWRVLRNLLSNVCKYAQPGTRVYINAAPQEGKTVRLTMKNISKAPLNISSEELMERFVRGDSSRHTEGSGLGLNIAQSLVELMHGRFFITIDGDLFRADIILPTAQ